jgi:hypothetical protein
MVMMPSLLMPAICWSPTGLQNGSCDCRGATMTPYADAT